MSMQPIYDWIDAHADECIRDLQRLVRQPSISAQGMGLRECAALVRDMMHDARMPPYMRDSNYFPLSLSRRQYHLVMSFIDYLEAHPPAPETEPVGEPRDV